MKILLIDDYPLLLSGLAAMVAALRPDATVLSAGSVGEAHALLAEHGPVDTVLLDLTLPDDGGLAALARIRDDWPTTGVMVLAAGEQLAEVVRAIDLGAMGFISKHAPNAELEQALTLVLAGGVYVPAALLAPGAGGTGQVVLAAEPGALLPAQPLRAPVGAALDSVPASPAAAAAALGLTPRQGEVLGLLLKGLPNKLIARELNLSVETVKDHVAALLRTLEVSSRTQAVLAVSRLTQGAAAAAAGAPRSI